MRRPHACLLLPLALACGRGDTPAPGGDGVDALGRSAPTGATLAANEAVARSLPLDDPQDFEDASRGRVAGDAEVVIQGDDGRTIWDTRAYAFVAGQAPDSVNPSLWRQARLNGLHGLFEVAPGVYQVRGYDIANLSLIHGESGWIVVDPLGTRETAAAA